MFRFLLAALAVLLALPAHAQSRPGEKQFMILFNHQPSDLQTAVRTGQDALKAGVKEFRIVLDGRAVLMVIPGSNIAQKEYMQTVPRQRGLSVIACKETVDLIARNAKRRPPLLPGVRVQPCEGMRKDMQESGWQRAMGF